MRRPSVVAAALIAISCGAAQASEEWGGSPGGPQAADAEAPTRTRFQAPPPPPRRPDLPLERQTAVYVTAGLGTPVGSFGLEAVHRTGPYFELAGGLGLGASGTSSDSSHPTSRTLQWSLMPRLRVGRTDYNSLTVGAGVSGGQYGGFSLCLGCDDGATNPIWTTHYTLWSNFEIGGEHWTRAGFAIRYFAGFAHGTVLDGANVSPLSFPYTGVGIGYAF